MRTPIGIDLANVSCIGFIVPYRISSVLSSLFDISFRYDSTAHRSYREMFDVCCVCLLGCGACCEGADIFASPMSRISFHFAGSLARIFLGH